MPQEIEIYLPERTIGGFNNQPMEVLEAETVTLIRYSISEADKLIRDKRAKVISRDGVDDLIIDGEKFLYNAFVRGYRPKFYYSLPKVDAEGLSLSQQSAEISDRLVYINNSP